MFFYILLIIWLIVVPAIIILSKRDLKSNTMLFLVQLYNFIVGLSAWIIYFITVCISLKYFGENDLFYIILTSFLILIFSILLIPINSSMKKKININTIGYILLSLLMIGLGVITLIVLYI